MKKTFLSLLTAASLTFAACVPTSDTYYHVINTSEHDLALKVNSPYGGVEDTLWHIVHGDTCCLGVYNRVGTQCHTNPEPLLGYGGVQIVFDDSVTLCYPYMEHDSVAPDGRNIYSAANWKACPRQSMIKFGVTLEDDYYTITEEDYRRAKEKEQNKN